VAEVVTSDLFVACAGFDRTRLARVVPPDCLREVDAAARPRRDGADTIVESAPWSPRGPAVHLVPSFSAPGAPPPSRLEVSARVGGAWSPWLATVTLGDAEFPPLATEADGLRVDIDELRASRPVEAVRVRVRCRGALPAAWLATLSVATEATVDADASDAIAALGVPPLTQMDADPAIALRICSPTSVAMVVRYWGGAATVAAMARDAFHAATDRYGVWPAAIRAAAAHGVAGYLLRFPGWRAAAWCLAQGLPIIASLRYAAGELDDAPVGATTGHLVVLTGYEDGIVLVNDPAGASARDVPRRYRRGQLVRAWLGGSGVGYVLFDPRRI
jgi:hypothetical protein